MKLATFHTLDLDTLNTWVFEAGWDYVKGHIYAKGDLMGSLVMHDKYYSIEDAT